MADERTSAGNASERYKAELLKANPHVSIEVVGSHNVLEQQLKQLGVDTRPHYTLGAPLSGTTQLYNDKS